VTSPGFVRAAVDHVRTPLYLNAYAMIASNLLNSGLGLVYWGLAARLYTVEALGISSAVISSMTFVIGISQLNMRASLVRLVPGAGARAGRLVGLAYVLSLVAAVVVAAVVFGVMALSADSPVSLAGLATPVGILFLIIGSMTWTIFALQDGAVAGLRRSLWLPLENGTYGVAKIVLLFLLVGAAPAMGILVSWILPMLAVVVVVTVVLAFKWLPAHMAASQGRSIGMGTLPLIRFVAADYVGSLFTLAVTALLPVLIVAIAGPRQGAFFYIVWTISNSINLLPLNITASMTVEAIHSQVDVASEVRRSAIHLARLLLPVVAIVFVFADKILLIFGADYAAGGTDALRLAALGAIPYAARILYLAVARIGGRGRQIMVIQAAASILTVVLALAFVGALGVTGVALGWLLGEACVAVFVVTIGLWPLLRPPRPSVQPAA
jgi:O-antigen/teichoic acid export membrane protein